MRNPLSKFGGLTRRPRMTASLEAFGRRPSASADRPRRAGIRRAVPAAKAERPLSDFESGPWLLMIGDGGF